MSIANTKNMPSNINELALNRLKAISKSINIFNIYNNENNLNQNFREINSLFNYNKNYKNKYNKITTKTQSIENIFNTNKKNKNSNSPIKINLIQNNNNINENNLNTINYSFSNDIKLERKNSAKSIKCNNSYSLNKSINIYKNNSLIFEPFSSKRILTIPTQQNHFGYAIDDNGETELLDDPQMYEKFNGTKNNSIGPGQYNVVISPRKKLIIDWSKISEDNILNINKKRKIKNTNELNKLDNIFLSTNLINEKLNDVNDNDNILMFNNSKSLNIMDMSKFRKKIFRNNNIGLKDYKTDDDYINLTSLNYIKPKKEEENLPGPGAYNYSDVFLIIPKKNKFQNFGSSVSRDLLYSPKRKKKNLIDDYIKYSFFADKNIKDKKINIKKIQNEKTKIYKNSKFLTEKVKIELLKEKNIKNKIEEQEKLGPGFYNPEMHKLKKTNRVENFGTLEKRKLTTGIVDTPGAGSYIPLKDWTIKYNYNFKTLENDSIRDKDKLNIINQNKELKIKKDYEKKNEIQKEDAYFRQSIDYDNKVISVKNQKRPGFGSGEPRFHIFKSQINELNGVGKYNLLPPKRKNKQQLSPFIYSSSRSNYIKNDNNVNIGPGTYKKFDTFFEWNKKTYNVKLKNKIDKYK